MKLLPTVDRFWSKVNRDGECWEWMGAISSTGYGAFWLPPNRTTAHRASWIITNGDIPQGLHILHRCDNRKCVRPDHLFIGTNTDNIMDMVKKGRHWMKNRPGRIPRGETHYTRRKGLKLTRDKAIEIRASSESGKILAARYGVSPQNITNVRKGRIWS